MTERNVQRTAGRGIGRIDAVSRRATVFEPRIGVDEAAARVAARARGTRRSAQVMELVTRIDPAASTQGAQTQIMAWIREEYDKRGGGILIGLFARCYLGPPYVDHKLDLFGIICRHYAPADSVEYPFSQARGLVRNDAYQIVEVYSDGAVVAVRPDGTPVVTSIGGGKP